MLIHRDSDGRKYKYHRKHLVEALLSVAGPVCAHCDRLGAPGFCADGRPWTVERIIPGIAGGEYQPENVALACWSCNSRRGARPLEKRVFSLWEWMDMRYTWYGEVVSNMPPEEGEAFTAETMRLVFGGVQ
jgi:5-methylcytosine-specific restriction endonuclease McrA